MINERGEFVREKDAPSRAVGTHPEIRITSKHYVVGRKSPGPWGFTTEEILKPAILNFEDAAQRVRELRKDGRPSPENLCVAEFLIGTFRDEEGILGVNLIEVE